MSYSCLSKFACVSNRSEGNPAWAWRRRSMDRPKLAICAVEKAPPSFPPAFCRTLIGLPPIISLRERAGGRRASEPHLTICHCQPVGRLVRRTDASARFASLRNTFQLQRQLPPVSSDGEDTDTCAEDFLRGFFSERSRTGGNRAEHSSATRRRHAHPPFLILDSPFFLSSVLSGATPTIFKRRAYIAFFSNMLDTPEHPVKLVGATSENSTARSSDGLSLL